MVRPLASFVLLALTASAGCTDGKTPTDPATFERPLEPPLPENPPILGEDASPITFEDMAKFPEPGWQIPRAMKFSPSESAITYLMSESGTEEMSLMVRDLATGEKRTLLRAAQLQTSEEKSLAQELRDERQRKRIKGITDYQWASNADVVLVAMGSALFLSDLSGKVTTVREGLKGTPIDPKICSDGSKIAYALGSELAVLDVATKTETVLTKGAKPGVTRGQSDFNAQEEFDEPSGHFFSPDCKSVLYLEVDESGVGEVSILGHRNGAPSLETQKYPEAGKANPKVTLNVVDVATKKSRVVALPKESEGGYLGRFTFTSPDTFLFVSLSRSQRTRTIYRAGPSSVDALHSRTSTKGWLSMPDLAVGQGGALFFIDENGGHDHLFTLAHADAAPTPKQLTRGDFDVIELLGASSTEPVAWITSTDGAPIGRNVFRVDAAKGAATKVSKHSGTNAATFSKTGKAVAFVHSALDRPPAAEVAIGDKTLAIEVPKDETMAKVESWLRKPERFTIERGGGASLHGVLLAPRVVEPGKRYPMLVNVYGGPGVQTVMDRWAPRLHWQHLADRGFYVMQVDNRGSSGRGPAFEQAIDRKLGEVELEDQITAVRYVMGTEGAQIDPKRVGIYGHSYGGFLAAAAMLSKTETPFSVGIAGSPVTDWRLYDTGYTERYMGTPAENPAGYDASTLAKLAGNLRGRLLIIHALMDENVHFQNTASLVDALVKANKPFEMFVFPGERHGYRSKEARMYAFGLVTRTLVDAFGDSPSQPQ